MIQIRALGPLAVARPDGSEPAIAPFQRRLLAVLIASWPEGCLADTLADELYGDELPNSWSSGVRNGVVRLRKAIGSDAVELVSGRYRLHPHLVSVDAWDLLDPARRASGDRPLGSLIDGLPFEGVEPAPMLTRCANRIDSARRNLIEQLATGTGHDLVLDDAALAALRGYWRRNSFDDDLLGRVLEIHVRANEHRAAADLIAEARADESRDPRELGLRALAVEERIEHERPVGTLLSAPQDARALLRVPAELQRVLDNERVGRATNLADLIDVVRRTGHAVVRGPSGTGKTFLVAAMAEELVRTGTHVFFASAKTDHGPFGAFADAIPGVADRIDELFRSATTPEAGASRVNSLILDAVREFGRESACIVIDDAHFLDSHSERLADLLIERRGRHGGVSVVLVRATDQESSRLTVLEQRLDDSDATLVELWPFTISEMRVLVRRTLGPAPDHVLTRLASEVHHASGGLPGLAHFIIQQVDRSTNLLPPPGRREPTVRGRLAELAASMSSPTRECAIAAAALGPDFSASDVATLTDLASARVSEALHELERRLFIRRTGLDRFEFAHAIHRLAVRSSVDDDSLLSAHLDAAKLSTSPRRRAHHLLAAGNLAPLDDVVAAVREAASSYFADGAWREAASAYVELRERTTLTDDELCCLGEALDRTGADGSGPRSVAFERASKAKRWSRAVAAAVSGLPATERLHGDPARVAMLESIPRTRLQPEDRFEIATTLVRQLMFLGLEDEAASHAQEARRLAQVPEQRLLSLVSDVLAGTTTDDPTPLEVPVWFDRVESPVLALRGLQIVTLNNFERADGIVARQLLERLTANTMACDDDHRHWHLSSLEVMMAFADGADQRAAELSERSREHGERHGIGDAETAYLGQVLFPHWLRGSLGSMQSDLPRYLRSGDSIVNRLLGAVIQAAGNGPTATDGQALVMRLAERLVQSRSIFSVPALALAAETLAAHAPNRLLESTVRRLRRRSGTSAIVGNGMLDCGPVDRAIAVLAEGDERDQALARAIHVADRQERRVWQVVTRLDAFAALGAPALLDEARGLATTAELAQLIDVRLEQPALVH